VFRICKCDKTTPFVLVQASNDRQEYALLKGHIESGEDPRETAVREVKEETGCWARVSQWLADVPPGADRNFRVYLMEFQEKSKPWPAENRQYQWVTLDTAIETALSDDTKELLKSADKRIKDLSSQPKGFWARLLRI
jgi:8-oxo-dGTP pyrophosphatase MutT (NUDIX family)